jgi:RNA polymerase sigma-70 factor (sigma-E family)
MADEGGGGGRDDYDGFFVECLPSVMPLACRLTGDRVEAEDIAIEALGRAYAHWSKLQSAPYRRAWVLRVATNLVIGRARRRRPTLAEPEATLDVADVVVVREALIAALRRLPRRQREAVVLRHLADISEEETATVMGVSTGSVKTHLSRGITALRSAIATSEEGIFDVS